MIVWFDEERMVFQYIDQKVFCRIHHDHDLFFFQTFHNVTVNRIRKTCRDAACKDQHISLFQCIQFLKQSFKFFTSDRRSCAVDLRSIDGFEFDVDPGKSILKLDKFGCNAHLLDFSADLLSGETGDKSKCRTLNAEIFQNDRDVDPLSTGKHLL